MAKDKEVRFTIDLDKSLHAELKLLCTEQLKTMKDFLHVAIKKEIANTNNKIEELKKGNIYEK